MSKKIKQMEMEALRGSIQGVRDMVVLSTVGIESLVDNQIRLALRKKKISMLMVKNTLARRVFSDMGLQVDGIWEGPTVLAWGGDGVADLSKAIEGFMKKNPKMKVKGAIAEGQKLTFEQALQMPTRAEALGTVLSMVLGPGAQIAGCIAGPAGQIAGQIKTLADKKPEEAAAPAAAAG